ncbi:MAG: VCBS repeat-containing protein [Acidobacteriota bacterium]
MDKKWFLTLIIFIAASCTVFAFAQAPQFVPAPDSPVAVGEGSGLVLIADVNRDGKPDLITQHLLQRVVSVQLGDGTGRFVPAPASPIKLAYSPGGIKSGEVNGDSILDLVIVSGERNAVDILLGDGGGKFHQAPGAPFSVGAATGFNTGLQLADINEDGKLDIIAVSNQRNSFGTLFGNGRGGFTPGATTSFTIGQGRYAFAFGDVDGDKHLDAVIANTGSGDEFSPEPGKVVVLGGDGKGTFNKLSQTTVPLGTRWVALGDLNGDGRDDLTLNHSGGQLSTLLNQGGGKFAAGSSYDLNTNAFAVNLADVNQDKRNDLIVATVDSVTVLLNGKNRFAPAPGSPFRAGPGAYHLAVGDVNRDGKPDIAASSFEGKLLTVLLGR